MNEIMRKIKWTHDARPWIPYSFRAANNALLFVDAQRFEWPSAATGLFAIDGDSFLQRSLSCCGCRRSCSCGCCGRRRGNIVGSVRIVQPPREVGLRKTGVRIDWNCWNGSIQTANDYAISVRDLLWATNSINLKNIQTCNLSTETSKNMLCLLLW